MPSTTLSRGPIGAPVRPRHPDGTFEPDEQELKMAELREQGHSYADIGELFDISRQAVYLRLTNAGLASAKGTYICKWCHQRAPKDGVHQTTCEAKLSAKAVVKALRPGRSGRIMTIEEETKQEYIVAAYRRGDRIFDISKSVRTQSGKPMAYTTLYAILRKHGIEPDRGGGHYKRTPETLERVRASQRTRGTGVAPVRGWRAEDD